MSDELQLRLALGSVFLAFVIVRLNFQIQAKRSEPVTEFEGTFNIVLRILSGLAGIAVLILYLIRPDSLAWASVAASPRLRWFGLPLGLLSVALLVWVHLELGLNFRSTLHLRPEHALVTSGPYRWVRNPMYTAFYALVLAFSLLSSNWLIALVFIGGLTAVMISRVGKEETLMKGRFGKDYLDWASRTGRFLPRMPMRHTPTAETSGSQTPDLVEGLDRELRCEGGRNGYPQ